MQPGPPSDPRIAVVLPRNMSFGPASATSIDLCVHDFVAHSRFRASTIVVADAIEAPFTDLQVSMIRRARWGDHRLHAIRLWRQLRSLSCDLVVVHQHLPTAALLALLMPKVPVILHGHNFMKARSKVTAPGMRARQLRRISGFVFVSDAVRAAFARDWPDCADRSATVHNGLDASDWRPAAERERMVLLVSRAHPVKGVAETIEALRQVLPRHPAWRAVLVLSEQDGDAGYRARLQALIADATATLGDRLQVLWRQPFAVVKHWNERAAIALVPSIWAEPFGRTAIEAHMGGAALISSGTGGLSEISGDTAVILPQVTPGAIVDAIDGLIRDDERRQRIAAAGTARSHALFDLGVVGAALDDFYAETLARHGRSRP